MRQRVLGLWAAREWRRGAALWSSGAVALLIGPSSVLALPWGIAGKGSLFWFHYNYIWYISAYVGAVAGLLILARAGALWDEVGPLRQAWLSVIVIGACSLVHGLVALGSLQIIGVAGGPALSAGLLCLGHWSAIGALLQRAPVGFGAKWLLLSCLGWWIPALLADEPGWDRVHWLLSPGRHLDVVASQTEASWWVVVDTIPLVAWWVAAALLPTRSAFSR